MSNRKSIIYHFLFEIIRNCIENDCEGCPFYTEDAQGFECYFKIDKPNSWSVEDIMRRQEEVLKHGATAQA